MRTHILIDHNKKCSNLQSGAAMHSLITVGPQQLENCRHLIVNKEDSGKNCGN